MTGNQKDVLTRWAKVLIVDGVMGLIYHTFNSDNENYQIRCTIKTNGVEISVNLGKAKPFTQSQFDATGEGLVRSAIMAARNFGFTPQRMAE